MRHVLLFLAALILLAFAAVVVWSNRHALTMVHLGFAGGCILLAFGFAAPADLKTAATAASPYLPMLRGGAGNSSGSPS